MSLAQLVGNRIQARTALGLCVPGECAQAVSLRIPRHLDAFSRLLEQRNRAVRHLDCLVEPQDEKQDSGSALHLLGERHRVGLLQLFTQADRLHDQVRGVVEVVQRRVDLGQRSDDLGFGQRILQLLIELRARLGQNFVDIDLPATRHRLRGGIERSDRRCARQDRRQELRDAFGATRFRDRAIALHRRAQRLALQQPGEDQQARQHERRGAERTPVASDVARDPVDAADSARMHGVSRHMAPDVVGEVLDRLVALRRLFLQRMQHDRVEITAQMPRKGLCTVESPGARGLVACAEDHRARQRRRLFADETFDFGGAPVPEVEHRLSAEQFVEQRSELVHVAGDRGARPAHLLRRGVARRKKTVLRGGAFDIEASGHGERLGDAEVDQPGQAVRIDEHVRRLDVAMQDEVAVRVLHGFADAEKQLQPLRRRQLPRTAIRVDGLSLHVLHDVVRLALAGDAGVEQPRDAGMIERGENLALALEPPDHLGVQGTRRQDLDRHLMPHETVDALALVDHAHAAAADFRDDAIGTEARADRARQRELCERDENVGGAGVPARVGAEQVGERVGEGGIFAAQRVDEPRGCRRIQIERGVEQTAQALPLRRGQSRAHFARLGTNALPANFTWQLVMGLDIPDT